MTKPKTKTKKVSLREGERLRVWRRRKRVLQRDLARRFKVSPMTASNWERGRQVPPRELMRLVDADASP